SGMAAFLAIVSSLPSLLFPLAAVACCPFLIVFVVLHVPLPSQIADRKKLYVTELFMRIAGEYGGELVEMLFGPEWRNSYLRGVMALGFYLPVPYQEGVEYSWTSLNGISTRVLRPAERRKRRDRTIVYIHGGGWATMRPQYYDHALVWLVAKLGCTVFAVDYRLAPEHPYPAAVEDCEDAVTALTDRKLREYGLTAGHVCVMGDSAGGNLCAVISRRLRQRRLVRCQVLIYPVTTVFGFSLPSYRQYFEECAGSALLNPFSMARWILFYLSIDANSANVAKVIAAEHTPRGSSKLLDSVLSKYERVTDKYFPDERLAKVFYSRGLDPDVSPLLAPDLDGCPPTMVLTAGVDVLRDEGRAYAKRLAAAGVAVNDKHYPQAYHGILNMPYSRTRATMQRDIVAYLEKAL
ncbi:hypothetical protein PFISCL1PPCAC_22644, partial [Pristionchus fissidentatus]